MEDSENAFFNFHQLLELWIIHHFIILLDTLVASFVLIFFLLVMMLGSCFLASVSETKLLAFESILDFPVDRTRIRVVTIV